MLHKKYKKQEGVPPGGTRPRTHACRSAHWISPRTHACRSAHWISPRTHACRSARWQCIIIRVFGVLFRIYIMIKTSRPSRRRQNASHGAETIRLLFIFPGALYTLVRRSDASAKSKSSIIFYYCKKKKVSF